MGKVLVKEINKDKELIELLNSILNSQNIYQLYMKCSPSKKSKKTFNFDMKVFKEMKFKLKWGNSIPNPNRQKIALEVTK